MFLFKETNYPTINCRASNGLWSVVRIEEISGKLRVRSGGALMSLGWSDWGRHATPSEKILMCPKFEQRLSRITAGLFGAVLLSEWRLFVCVCLLICWLFNDTFSGSDCIVWSCRTNSEIIGLVKEWDRGLSQKSSGKTKRHQIGAVPFCIPTGRLQIYYSLKQIALLARRCFIKQNKDSFQGGRLV